MRILYLVHNVAWKGGGAFFRAFHQARLLARSGHAVTILSTSPTARAKFRAERKAGVEIVEAPDLLPGLGRTGWDLWNTLRRIHHLRGRSFDLVHGFESRPVVALPALYLKLTRGLPTVLDWADWYGRGGTARERGALLRYLTEPLETFCEEFFHPLADACVAMGEPLAERAAASGLPPDRILNLLHGCDPEGLAPLEAGQARARLPLPARDGFILGYLGVMRPSTARLLFEAFRAIRARARRPATLLLIGNHKLRLERCPGAAREDGVVETGWVDYQGLNLYLAACDLLLLPFARTVATDSIWPSKLNDHLAVARPTVATSLPILKPVFARHDIGVLVPHEPQAFAEACLSLLADPARRHAMGLAARRLAETELSWPTLVDQLETFYGRLVAEVRASRAQLACQSAGIP